jgi:hypothetical protein
LIAARRAGGQDESASGFPGDPGDTDRDGAPVLTSCLNARETARAHAGRPGPPMLKGMRRLLSLIASIGLICAGAYFVYGEVSFGLTLHGRLLAVGMILIAIGVARLWFDFMGLRF